MRLLRSMFVASACSLVLGACATQPTVAADPSAPAAADTSVERTIEGKIASVDTAPWAYDGSAVVKIDTGATGTVEVHLPARWNLCKAPPPDDVQSLKPGDRVQASGESNADGAVVVCAQATHYLRRAR